MNNLQIGKRYFILLKDLNPKAPEGLRHLALFFRKVAVWDDHFTVEFDPINSDIYARWIKQAIDCNCNMTWLDKAYEEK